MCVSVCVSVCVYIHIYTCILLVARVTKCTSSYQCEGGFVCLNDECSCPHNYWPVAHNTKCAKENGRYRRMRVCVRVCVRLRVGRQIDG